MATIPVHLSNAEEDLRLAQIDLDLALNHATSRRYASNWLEAIRKALADNLATRLHIANIRTCLDGRPDPPD